MNNTISVTGRRLVASAAIGGVALFVGALGLVTGPGAAQAASPGCTAAPFHATPEQSIGTAFVDVGQGNKATFVCITSPAFTGGSSNEITTNGSLLNGCYVVEGLGTSVVAVFWEQPDVRPDCVMITNIDVGMQAGATATPATTTPDRAVPATSANVQHQLGLKCGAYDINAACSGFVYALVNAHGLIAMGAKKVLVIGTDTLSRITDWTDRGTAILFADGSGACVLEAVDGPGQ